MVDMSMEYKIDVIGSLINVLKTYPNKHETINNFLLTTMNRETAKDIKIEVVKVLEYEI